MMNTFDIDAQLALMLSQCEVETESDIKTTPKYVSPKVKLYPKMIDKDEAMAMFVYLKENITWEEGIQTRRGKHTRLACGYSPGTDRIIDNLLLKMNSTIPSECVGKCKLVGVYLNYQRNGKEYTPTHFHEGGFQQVICLGPAKRVFTISSKNYTVGNGDVVVFGAQKHGLPKDTECEEERISIATFYVVA
jgi:hypothetical protein